MHRRRNPLPTNKRNKIAKTLKVSDKDKYLDWIGESDPTKKGTYSEWVAYLVNNSLVRFPDDIKNLKENLYWYDKRKKSLPKEMRNIFHFKTRGQLSQILDEYALFPTSGKNLIPEIVEWVESGRSIEGLDIFLRGDEVTVIEISNPDSLMELAQSTSWCVKDEPYNSDYLRKSNLFLIYLNKKRYYLYQPEIKVTIGGNELPSGLEKLIHSILGNIIMGEPIDSLIGEKAAKDLEETLELLYYDVSVGKTRLENIVNRHLFDNKTRIANVILRSIEPSDFSNYVLHKDPSTFTSDYPSNAIFGLGNHLDCYWEKGKGLYSIFQLKDKWDDDVDEEVENMLKPVLAEINKTDYIYEVPFSDIDVSTTYVRWYFYDFIIKLIRPNVINIINEEIQNIKQAREMSSRIQDFEMEHDDEDFDDEPSRSFYDDDDDIYEYGDDDEEEEEEFEYDF